MAVDTANCEMFMIKKIVLHDTKNNCNKVYQGTGFFIFIWTLDRGGGVAAIVFSPIKVPLHL
jgi:hypothetical protein